MTPVSSARRRRWRPRAGAARERTGCRETAAGVERRVPLYEAKMIHHFDHRWATYGAGTSDDEEGARDCTLAEKQNPDFEPSPRYWVPEEEVILRAARVPSALKSAVRLARGEGGKGRRKADTDLEENSRSRLRSRRWSLGLPEPFPSSKATRRGSSICFAFLAARQDWRGSLKASPERFLLDPKTLSGGMEMQRETPLTPADLTLIAEGPNDALALAELLIDAKQPRWLMGWRDIALRSVERTVIASVFPKVGIGDTILPIVSGSLRRAQGTAALSLAMLYVADT